MEDTTHTAQVCTQLAVALHLHNQICTECSKLTNPYKINSSTHIYVPAVEHTHRSTFQYGLFYPGVESNYRYAWNTAGTLALQPLNAAHNALEELKMATGAAASR